MRMELIYRVVTRIVESKHNVALNAIRVVDEEIRNRRAVRDEQAPNSLGRDLVLSFGVRSEGAVGRAVRLRGSSRSE